MEKKDALQRIANQLVCLDAMSQKSGTPQAQRPPQALRFPHGRGECETRVTGDEPQGIIGRLQTASRRKNVMSMRELFRPDPLAEFEKMAGFQVFYYLKIKCFHS